MQQFLGTHQNRLDAKGRVSVPAPFRTALRNGVEPEQPTTVILRPSHKHPCIEAWPPHEFEALTQSFARLSKFSDEYEDLSTTIFADAYPVEADKEGRIVVPADLVEYAALTSQVAFMGVGDIFQIWEPAAAAKRRADARTGSRLRELSLPSGGTPA